ncbi:MAG: BrnT family toxin [Chloroflexota bacterium]
MVTRLIWDDWNVAHIAKHNVTPAEVEELIQDMYVIKEAHSGRSMVLGMTQAGRVLAVIIRFQGSAGYYVVTARPADRAERRIYQEELLKGGEQAA